MLAEEDVLSFAAFAFPSIWTLELMLTLKADACRAWDPDELIHELRSSHSAVAESLDSLCLAGLAAADSKGRYSYQPSSEALHGLVEEVERIYRIKPVAVIRAIVASPDRKLRAFSNAFKLKE